MKEVTYIEMANDTDIFSVDLGRKIRFKKASDGEGFDLYYESKLIEEICHAFTRQEARRDVTRYLVDGDLIISGYGKHSGCKFWQLPKRLQGQIRNLARKRETKQ